MHAIILAKLRGKMTKELTDRVTKVMKDQPMGVKIHSIYWTLGRYDSVLIIEAPDEKTAMKILTRVGDYAATETMVAIPREEAIKLL